MVMTKRWWRMMRRIEKKEKKRVYLKIRFNQIWRKLL